MSKSEIASKPLGGYLLIEEGDAKLPAEERVRRLGQSAETFAEWQKG